jgi:hypothetical protein
VVVLCEVRSAEIVRIGRRMSTSEEATVVCPQSTVSCGGELLRPEIRSRTERYIGRAPADKRGRISRLLHSVAFTQS